MPRNLVTGPDIYPVTLGQVKEYLGLTQDDTTFDAFLKDQLIPGAVSQVEKDLSRAIVEQSWIYYFPSFPASGEFFQIPFGKLRSVTSIEYRDSDGDWNTVSSSVYEIETHHVLGRIYLKDDNVWGYVEAGDTLYSRDPVRITAKVGYCGLVQSVTAQSGTSETKIVFPAAHNLKSRDAIVNTTINTEPILINLQRSDITNPLTQVALRETVATQTSGNSIKSYDLSSIPGIVVRLINYLIAGNFEYREPILAAPGAFALKIPDTYDRLLGLVRVHNV